MTKFEEFLKKENEQNRLNNKFNPQERIDKFKTLVDGFYSMVKDEWLKPYIESGAITISSSIIPIHEERLGIYNIGTLTICIGNKRVDLRPIGTIMIGTDARIDMIYRAREIMIVRVGENINNFGISVTINGEPVNKKEDPGKPVWKCVNKRARTSYVTLNAETFQGLLMAITDETR